MDEEERRKIANTYWWCMMIVYVSIFLCIVIVGITLWVKFA